MWWVLLSGVAAAEAPPPQPAAAHSSAVVELGVRAGFDLPLGNVDGAPGDRLEQTISASVPLWFDFGVRFATHWYAGAYASYGFGFAGNALASACTDCSVDDARFGAQLHYDLFPGASWGPWFGAGSGFEWLRIYDSEGGASTSGWELLNLQCGLDYRVSDITRVGPFLALSLAEYDSVSSDNSSGPSSFASRAFHEWLLAGFRAAFDIQGQ